MSELDRDYVSFKRWLAGRLRRVLVKLDPEIRAVITPTKVTRKGTPR